MINTYLDGKNLEPYKNIVSRNINNLVLAKMDDIIAGSGFEKEDILKTQENMEHFAEYIKTLGIVPKTMKDPKKACETFCLLYGMIVSKEKLFPSLTVQYFLAKIIDLGTKESIDKDYNYNGSGMHCNLPRNLKPEIYECVKKDIVSDLALEEDYANMSVGKIEEEWGDLIVETFGSFEHFSCYLFDYFFKTNKFFYLDKLTEEELKIANVSKVFKIFPDKVSDFRLLPEWWMAA